MPNEIDLNNENVDNFLTDVFNSVVAYRDYCELNLRDDIAASAKFYNDVPETFTITEDDGIQEQMPAEDEVTPADAYKLLISPFYMNVTTRLLNALSWTMELKAARAGEKTLAEALESAGPTQEELAQLAEENLPMRIAAPSRLNTFDADSVDTVRTAVILLNLLREQTGMAPIELPENLKEENYSRAPAYQFKP